MDGFLLIDKPAGITSHDVVDRIRSRFQIRRVGHGGTLDPAATGLLVLFIGKATRQASIFLESDKTYLAVLRLGETTDTQDTQGRLLKKQEIPSLTRDKIETVFSRFRGEIEQEVPAYSAVRIQGKRSYALARAGLPVPRSVRRVIVYDLAVLNVRLPEIEFEVTCSKGTYIRALCAAFGEAFGCGGHLASLRRTRIGSLSIDQAVSLDEVAPHHVIPITQVDRRVQDVKAIRIPERARFLSPSTSSGRTRAKESEGRRLAQADSQGPTSGPEDPAPEGNFP